jgi:uncharacterized protein YjbI with pentapeptide repeats
MANEEQLAILKQGADVWNEWKYKHLDANFDLSGVDLSGVDLIDADLSLVNLTSANLSGSNLSNKDLTSANLSSANLNGANLRNAFLSSTRFNGADLRGADLTGAFLEGAYFEGAELTGANLQKVSCGSISGVDFRRARLHKVDFSEAELRESNFFEADLREAKLTKAMLYHASFEGANLRKADLTGAFLQGTSFARTDLSEANFTEVYLSDSRLECALIVGTQFLRAEISYCHVFGISAWNVNLEGAIQKYLVITSEDEPHIVVDNLEVAQFIYLLVYNAKLRDVIDTITSKAVLILGRFTNERKVVLDAIREELQRRNYIPILFDFEKPGNRDVTETVRLLAHMARFVIADLTDPRSLPHELMSFVEGLPSVVVQPLILSGQREYGMFEHFQRYPWVLPIHEYETQAKLIAELSDKVIEPAEAKVAELRPAK